MSNRGSALLVAFLFLCAYWWFSPSIFGWTPVNVSIPIFGSIYTLQPLAWLSQYSILIAGGLALLIYRLWSKGK